MSALGDSLLDPTVWMIAAGVSAVMFVGSLVALPHAVARLPVDYFICEPGASRKTDASMVSILARNVLGVVLLVMGAAMLVLPGQGVLTLLMGLALVDFPGKQRLERRLARQRHVRRSLQWMRKRAQRPPLEFDVREDASRPGPTSVSEAE